MRWKLIFLANYFINYQLKAFNPFLLWVVLFPRFKKSLTLLNFKKFAFADSASFISIYNEVFNRQIYRFKSNRKKPIILDCGANIGLSVLFFKRLYPNSNIICFEPDPGIFEILKSNCHSQNISDITFINKGLWKEETSLHFVSDGADGGKIAKEGNGVEIKTVCLSDYINEPIDFLKIDIEGAETLVLEECAHKLHLIENLFVEYHSFLNKPQELDKLLNILISAGFRYHIHQEGRFSKQPFIKRRLMGNMDLQLNIFAYRE